MPLYLTILILLGSAGVIYLACEYFNADTGLALVRAEHQSFYRRVFLHEALGEPRSIPNVLTKVALMASSFRTQREKVLARFPIMRSSAFERRMLFERGGERHPASADQRVSAFEHASFIPLYLGLSESNKILSLRSQFNYDKSRKN